MRSCGDPQEEAVGLSQAYLSLGSNQGDRHRTLEAALGALERKGIAVLDRSSVYETSPTDFAEQPWFLNLVARVETTLSPRGLMAACQSVEDRFGRERKQRFGPRTLDIDVLLFARQVIQEEELTVPHPRMHERRFVLVPLVEIAPDLTDPRDGRSFAEKLDGLDEGKQVVRSASIES